jgi:hypothetical protein
MRTSEGDPKLAARAQIVECTADSLVVELTDGREISVPLAWYPRLEHARPDERAHWELIGRGYGIHWPELDEDISIEGLLDGRKSMEGPSSFARWLAARAGSRS